MRLLIAALCCSLVACSGQGLRDGDSIDTTTTSTTVTTTSTTLRGEMSPTTTAKDEETVVKILPPGERSDEAIVDAARRDLADRLQIRIGQIRVDQDGPTEVSTADPCGDAGKDVTAPGQVVGYQVVLEAEGSLHTYVAVAAVLHYCGTG